MLVNVVYHEKLREEVGKPIESFNVDESANVASLLARLSAAYPSIRFSTADISRRIKNQRRSVTFRRRYH